MVGLVLWQGLGSRERATRVGRMEEPSSARKQGLEL